MRSPNCWRDQQIHRLVERREGGDRYDSEVSLSPGESFAGFRVIKSLGAGGMGHVYLVEHPRLPRREALKVLSAEFTANDEFRQRFLQEAELAAALWHPNLVTIHDRGEADERLWISMDYVEGSDAAELLRDRYPQGMPADQVVAIVTAIASALDYVHASGMMHRDVKPANILCSEPSAGVRRIALADFGIARQMYATGGITATNMTIGTVLYAAPEQLMGKPLDGRADQYALAASAFHFLTGSTPFADSNLAVVIGQHLNAPPPRLGDIRPELSRLDRTFARAMSKDPQDRFPSCGDFAKAISNDLNSAVAHEGETMAAPGTDRTAFAPGPRTGAGQRPPRLSEPEPATGPLRRPLLSPATLILSVLALGVVAAGVFVGSRFVDQSRQPTQAAPSFKPTAAPSPQPPLTVTVSASPSNQLPPPASQPVTSVPMVLGDADLHGFLEYGGGARCNGSDRAVVLMRTPQSALVVCQSSGGAAYYRGLRLSDMATIELTNIGVTDAGSTVVVTNPADGTRYSISNMGLEIVKDGEVLASEPAIEFATP